MLRGSWRKASGLGGVPPECVLTAKDVVTSRFPGSLLTPESGPQTWDFIAAGTLEARGRRRPGTGSAKLRSVYLLLLMIH